MTLLSLPPQAFTRPLWWYIDGMKMVWVLSPGSNIASENILRSGHDDIKLYLSL